MDQKTIQELSGKILNLKKERKAVILAHFYQRPEVQDVADFIGDSLGLSQQAAKTDADVIIFAASTSWESASILSPARSWSCRMITPAARWPIWLTRCSWIGKSEMPGAIVAVVM